jgi:L-lactate dehydrogenase complex protein LldE
MDVALFVTCLTDTFYPRAGRALVKILEYLGCRVHFPEAQTCCGQPMFNSGYPDEAAALARRMVDIFEPYETVVTPSGSCCAMIHDYYPSLLAEDPAYAQRVGPFVHKTHEFVDFLTNVAKVDLRELGCNWEGRVTYHYSCHLRGLGMTDESVRLLEQIEGVQYTKLRKLDQCCGFGGTFAVKWPEVSGAMVQDKVQCIAETEAETVICNDAGCTLNISGSAHRENVPVRFAHIAEVIAEGLGLMPREEARA